MGDSSLKFAKILKDIRESREISIRLFSSICGFSPAYISDLEKSNRKPTLNVINSIIENIPLSKEEKDSLLKAFNRDRLNIDEELLHYIIDNDLVESLRVFKEFDSDGSHVKSFAKTLKNDNIIYK